MGARGLGFGVWGLLLTLSRVHVVNTHEQLQEHGVDGRQVEVRALVEPVFHGYVAPVGVRGA